MYFVLSSFLDAFCSHLVSVLMSSFLMKGYMVVELFWF